VCITVEVRLDCEQTDCDESQTREPATTDCSELFRTVG
jgi:hypothetical protein